MDRRFLALTAAAFVLAFTVCWVAFAPSQPDPAPQAANAAPLPAAPTSDPALDQLPAPIENPPPPPSYQPEPDPTVVHRLG